MATVDAARSARIDLIRMLEQGEAPLAETVRLREARERFVQAARDGRALNKRGMRYKPSAIANIEECLRVHVEPTLGPSACPTSAAARSEPSSTTSRRSSQEAASDRS